MTTIGDLKTWLALAETLDQFDNDTPLVVETAPGVFTAPRAAWSGLVQTYGSSSTQWSFVIGTSDGPTL